MLGSGLAVGRGEALIAAAGAVMRLHLQIVPAPTVRLSRLGYDTALMGALAIAMRGLE